jgi:hypothetical protein
LSEILRKEKPKEFWPDWVWKCFDGIWKITFPKYYPRLSDKNGMSFLLGFAVGIVPRVSEIFSMPISEKTEAGIKTGFAVTPKENQKEILGVIQSRDFKKEISRFVSSEEIITDFWSSLKEARVAFSKGLLAGTMAEDDFPAAIERASGMTYNLNLGLWLSWPDVAIFSDVAAIHRRIEAAYHAKGFTPPSPEAFKQYAHRIGLSQFLKKQKQVRSK